MPNSMSLWGKSKNDSKCVKMTRHDANYQNSNIHSIAPLNLNTRGIISLKMYIYVINWTMECF